MAITAQKQLSLQAIGGPTAVLALGGLRIIIDPTFDPPQTYTGAGTEGTNGITKTEGPALTVEEVLPLDVALISHDHHIDNLDVSGRALLTHVPTVVTTDAGAERLGNGTRKVDAYESIEVPLPAGGALTITGVPAHHGPDGIWQAVGPVTGFVLSGDTLPTVYVSGDNSDLEIVQEIADRIGNIDVAVLFAGGAKFEEVGGAYLTLSNEAVVEAASILNGATIVPLHADGWAHFSQTKDQLRDAFEDAGMGNRLKVANPGETVDIAL